MTTQVQKARQRVKIALIVVGIFALIILLTGAILFRPYSPLTVLSYIPLETTVCPGQSVEVAIEVETPASATVDRIESRSVWTAIDVEEITDGQEILGTQAIIQNPPTGEVVTEVLPRIAPRNPGVWQLGSEITVRNPPWSQHVEVTSDTPITILRKDDPACTPEERAKR